jgi:hypothetical protein
MTVVSSRRGLHRLMYASAFSGAFPSAIADQDEAVAGIIRASIRNNRASDITGLLLVHQSWFVQVLEGPAEAVMTTYGRILADPRHRDATLIEAASAEARRFANWNMCARRMSATDDAILDTLDLKGALDPSALSPKQALALLMAVRNIQQTETARLA